MLNLCVFYDRHSFQDVHKPISAQLLPAAAPNRFSNDTVRGEIGSRSERGERDLENNGKGEMESGKGRERGCKNSLKMSQSGIFAVQLRKALNVFESQT